MDRAFRLFLILYTLVLLTIAASQLGEALKSNDPMAVWFGILSTALPYLVLALAMTLSREPQGPPGKIWLTVFCITALGTPLTVPLMNDFMFPSEWMPTRLVTAVLAGVALLLFQFQPERASTVRRRLVDWSALAVGAGLVLSSLWLKTTYEAAGWMIVPGRRPWITNEASVGHGVFGPTIPWLQPIFGPTGWAFYVASLLATLGLLALAVKTRFSLQNLKSSLLFTRITALLGLSSLWAVTDIFWGWHYQLSSIPWSATLGAACWLAGLLWGAVLLVPVARGDASGWRMRWLLLSQIPIIAFNLTMFPTLISSTGAYLPGLAAVIAGLLLESWACMDLLVQAKAA